MKSIQKIRLEFEAAQQNLVGHIDGFAARLAPFPNERNLEQLRKSWNDVTSARRKLAGVVKDILRDLNRHPERVHSEARPLQSLRKALTGAQKNLRHSGRFEELAQAQLYPRPHDLMTKHATPDREAEVFDHVMALCLDALHKVANPIAYTQSKAASDLGFHRDIPWPMSDFSRMIGAALRLCLAQRKDGPLRFVDVGSGGGTKLLAATTCFEVCHGLEYEAGTVASGSKLLRLLAPDETRLFHQDALTFEGYGAYDVIFFFRPIAGTDKMAELEAHILSQLRPGTVLLVAGEMASADLEAKGVHKLADTVYLTAPSLSAARALKERAEQMGTMVPNHGRKRQLDMGFWTPLSTALAQNGYFV